MTGCEIVRRAIEFESPPRLPFWQHELESIPDDVCDCREMDRAKRGWFFGRCGEDDWGCGWAVTEQKNMGQVVHHPLEDWGRLRTYRPPNPRDSFYFERIEGVIAEAAGRYVVVTSHFNLIERLHMLHGFNRTLEDLYLEPAKIENVLDMVLEFKLAHFDELHRRFGDRVNGLFLTDDWGTQESTLISRELFQHFFLERYRLLVARVHGYGWHVILHSCGKINDFLPYFVEVGVDVMNMQQPCTNGIRAIGEKFAGSMAFLTTADIQATLPAGNPERIRAEVRELVEHWSTPAGGFIVFNYGDPEALGIEPGVTEVMFSAFAELMGYWETDRHKSRTRRRRSTGRNSGG